MHKHIHRRKPINRQQTCTRCSSTHNSCASTHRCPRSSALLSPLCLSVHSPAHLHTPLSSYTCDNERCSSRTQHTHRRTPPLYTTNQPTNQGIERDNPAVEDEQLRINSQFTGQRRIAQQQDSTPPASTSGGEREREEIQKVQSDETTNHRSRGDLSVDGCGASNLAFSDGTECAHCRSLT